jgi:conjugal transfer pilus assembly protein TraV
MASLLILVLALAGCAATLSGVDGAERYACKAPEGALCTSVSGVYANSAHGMPKALKPPEPKSLFGEPARYGAVPPTPGRASAPTSSALRSNPRVLRLWIAPWEDADGDLHEESLVHVLVDSGRWLIEHVRPASRHRIDGVVPPPLAAQDAASAKSPSDSPQSPTRMPLPPTNLSSGAEPAAMEP